VRSPFYSPNSLPAMVSLTIAVQFQPIATERAIALIGLLLVELFLVRDRLFAALVQLFAALVELFQIPITANFLHYPTSAAKVTQHFDTFLAKSPIPLLTVRSDNDRDRLQQLIDTYFRSGDRLQR
jgi:hypothetical protein